MNDPAASVLVDGTSADTARALVSQQLTNVWEEISSNKLKLDAGKAAEELARTLILLQKTDEGKSITRE